MKIRTPSFIIKLGRRSEFAVGGINVPRWVDGPDGRRSSDTFFGATDALDALDALAPLGSYSMLNIKYNCTLTSFRYIDN